MTNMFESALRKSVFTLAIIVVAVLVVRWAPAKLGIASALFFISDPAVRFLTGTQFLDFYLSGANNPIPPSAPGSAEGAIAANVLRVPPSVSFGSIIIDAGADSGIAEGMRVVLANNVFVGFIDEVFDRHSRVRLLSAFGRTEQVRLDGVGLVAAEGLGAMNIKIEVPRDIEIAIGDRVSMPGENSALAAIMEYVDRAGAKSIVEARAVLPFNALELDRVWVVSK